jgi:hypothetical protein
MPVVGGDEHAFADQRRRGDVQQTVTAACQRAPPHVPDGKKHLRGDNSVDGPKSECGP